MSVKLSFILGVLANVTAHADPIVFESHERQTAFGSTCNPLLSSRSGQTEQLPAPALSLVTSPRRNTRDRPDLSLC